MKKGFKFIFCLVLLSFCLNVNAEPANDSFIDDELYKCVIDSYNKIKGTSHDYSYNMYPEELNEITSMDCSNYKGLIDDLTGLSKLNNLTSLNVSGNTFLGGALQVTGESGKLKSSIILPKNLKITDINYTVVNSKIVKIVDGVVYPLAGGSTDVVMTGKVSGNEIKEVYKVSVPVDFVKKSNNAKLASLYLSEGDIRFDSDIRTYSVVVDNSVSSVKINANVLDKKASFVPDYGPRTVNLNVGTNTFYVKVKAEDGTINTYTISILRSDGNDLNNRLINIEVTPGNINFSPDIYIYNFTVDSNVDEIDVKAVSESALSKVDISSTKLKVGSNKITIAVTSESGSVLKYELIVTREDYDSLDNYLKSIVINGYDIKFDRDVFDYNLNIGYERKLNIIAECEKSDASYSIVGNDNLKDGSKVLIKVSDKEGSIREYTITVNKSVFLDLSFIRNINLKWIILFLEFIVILILILVLIFRKNNKPRKPKKVKKEKAKVQTSNITTNVCKTCGSVNDKKSKICYICGSSLE